VVPVPLRPWCTTIVLFVVLVVLAVAVSAVDLAVAVVVVVVYDVLVGWFLQFLAHAIRHYEKCCFNAYRCPRWQL